MSDVLYLAWRYLAFHRFKTITVVASIALILYLPLGLNVLVEQSARELTARAESTPLLIGAKGSSLELTLRSLYFASAAPDTLPYAELTRVQDSKLALAIPLHAGFRTRHSPIVGTSLEYFEFRQLRIERGRHFGMLGECVLGAQAARAAEAGPGDTILSASDNVFDIAGVYPLKMHVVGVLGSTGTPDDQAVFVDVKTAWVIAGLAHGHEDLNRPEADRSVLRREGDAVVANASLMQFNEITPENVSSFHFHGDPARFPLTAVIAVPQDEKSSTLLQGRYLGEGEQVQVVLPRQVISQLLRTIFAIEGYLLLAAGVIGVATCALLVLVFLLSIQLRRRELETIIKIGGSRGRVAALLAAEIVAVGLASALVAAALTLVTLSLADLATKWLINLA